MAVCNFCSEEFDDRLAECPNCGISVYETGAVKEDIYICPVCGAENSPGETKCQYCCSLFTD